MICGRRSAAPTVSTRTPSGTPGDAVRKALHDERPIGHRRQNERRDLRVVAEEIAFRQLLLRPEDLVQITDRQPPPTRQLEHAVFARVLEGAQLLDDSPGLAAGCSRLSAWGRIGHSHPIRCLVQPRLRLASHVFRFFVVAQPEVHRMPELSVGRPLGEFDFRDERRLDPVGTLIRLRLRMKRTLRRFDPLEPGHDPRKLALVESRARVADVQKGFGIWDLGFAGLAGFVGLAGAAGLANFA
jgi:hypothetical protein